MWPRCLATMMVATRMPSSRPWGLRTLSRISVVNGGMADQLVSEYGSLQEVLHAAEDDPESLGEMAQQSERPRQQPPSHEGPGKVMGEPSPLACAEAMRVGEETPRPDVVAIIVAGGSGERFGDSRGKQFVDLCGLPLMSWAILAFDRAPSVARIVVVCASERTDEVATDILSPLSLRCPATIARAGDTRQDSGHEWACGDAGGFDLVAVHDAARPLIDVDDIERACATVREDASIAGAVLRRSLHRHAEARRRRYGRGNPRPLPVLGPPRRHRSSVPVRSPPHIASRRWRAIGEPMTRHSWSIAADVFVWSRLRVTTSRLPFPGDLAVAEASLERRLIGGSWGGLR